MSLLPMRWTSHFAALVLALIAAGAARGAVTLEYLWSHDAGGLGRAEIVAYDTAAEEFLVVNGTERCVMRLDARTGRELGRLDLAKFGDPTSVATSRGLIAVAVVAPVKTDPGNVVLFRSAAKDGGERETSGTAVEPVAVVRVAALPDMVTFTPDGRYVLSANEGEPSDDYGTDPEGSVSVIDVSRGPENAVAMTADFVAFNDQRAALQRQGVRLVAPNANAADGFATVAQDLEPEYIAVTPDSRTAWVTLQENNALAEVDIASAKVKRIVALGVKDHSLAGNEFDASALDGGIHLRRWPVFGMYQPDGIAAFDAGGVTYTVTANEGDGRGYAGFSDEARVGELELDESLKYSNVELANPAQLGGLKVSRLGGDLDSDGDVDRLLAFGTRSIAVWDADGKLVWDSGNALEQYVAERMANRFNIENDGGDDFDTRSDDKGPEPEGLVVGRVGDATLAFVGLERISAVAVFDVTRPTAARLLTIVPFALTGESMNGPHIAPEGLCFVPAEKSPIGEPLLAVSCEVTGTTIVFRVAQPR